MNPILRPLRIKLLTESGQEVRLAAARITEREHVLFPVEERAIEECLNLASGFRREPFQIEVLHYLF